MSSPKSEKPPTPEAVEQVNQQLSVEQKDESNRLKGLLSDLNLGPEQLGAKTQKVLIEMGEMQAKHQVRHLEPIDLQVASLGAAAVELHDSMLVFLLQQNNKTISDLNDQLQQVMDRLEEVIASLEKGLISPMMKAACKAQLQAKIDACKRALLKNKDRQEQVQKLQLLSANEEMFSAARFSALLGRMEALRSLRSDIVKELERFRGLQPDLPSARQQLQAKKEEYEAVSRSMLT